MKKFPVYVVRVPIDEGCGHQHQTKQAAHNCAVAILSKRTSLPWARVVRVRRKAKSETLMEREMELVHGT